MKRISYAAVVVAAGDTERMKEFRRRTRADAVSFVRRAVYTFERAGVGEIVVVTGFQAERLERELSDGAVTFLRNERFATTRMFESAKIAFSYLAGRADRIFFCPADIPFFLEDTVRREMQRREKIVYPVYENKLGHPVLLDASLIPEILAYEGERGLKGALDALLGVTIGFVPVTDSATALKDAGTGAVEKLIDLQNAQLVRARAEVILSGTRPFLNHGVAELLSRIDELQSVREASDACGLSYSKAWMLLRAAENEVGYPLAERRAGGKNGGRAILTERGAKFLSLYRELSERTTEYAEREFAALSAESGLFPVRKPEARGTKGHETEESSDQEDTEELT